MKKQVNPNPTLKQAVEEQPLTLLKLQEIMDMTPLTILEPFLGNYLEHRRFLVQTNFAKELADATQKIAESTFTRLEA